MAHEEVGRNARERYEDVIASIPDLFSTTSADVNIPIFGPTTEIPLLLLGTLATEGGGEDPFPFFEQFNSDKKLPQSWDAFYNSWQQYVTDAGGTPSGKGARDSDNEVLNVLTYFYGRSIGLPEIAAFEPPNTIPFPTTVPLPDDWADLAGAGVTTDDLRNQAANAFSHFLETYRYPPRDPPDATLAPPIDSTEFGQKFEDFLRTAAVIKNPSDLVANDPTYVNIFNYKQVYETFFSSGFETKLIEFYNKVLEETGDGDPSRGYFIPSHSFDDWVREIADEFAKITLEGTPLLKTSVETEASKNVLLLERIFQLLVDMIDVLQRVAVAQAERLSFLSKWQRAYTDAMNQVHTFVAENGDGIDGSSDAEKEARAELNTTNTTYLEQLRGNRDVIKDDAKALQSVINQSNDAVSQQANIATSILQQFSTLLASIFR